MAKIKSEPIDDIVNKNDVKRDNREIFRDQLNFKREPSVEYMLILLSVYEDPPIKSCVVRLPRISLQKINEMTKSNQLVATCLCLKCDDLKLFESIEHLEEHGKKYHFTCQLCKVAYKCLRGVKTHSCKRNLNKKFKCEYCSKAFSNKYNLVQHESIHIDAKKVSCSYCGKRLVKARMAQHIKYSHETTVLLECDICSIKYKTKYGLNHHMDSHIKPHECPKCKRRFSELRYFNEHKLNHETPNPFSCTKCSSSYTRKTSLVRHMHTAHSTTRNFPCLQCSYRGKTKDDVTTHVKSHTKAYECDVCNRKFSRSTHLHEHRVLHDNPNAYQCKTCENRFKAKKNLKNHINKMHIKSSSKKLNRQKKSKKIVT